MTKKAKYNNFSAIFLSPKFLQPMILKTTLNFTIGLQLSSKWSQYGLLFTPKVVFNWSPMETFFSQLVSIPADSQLDLVSHSDLDSMSALLCQSDFISQTLIFDCNFIQSCNLCLSLFQF